MKDLGLLILIALIAYGLGARLISCLRIERRPGAEDVAFSMALGLGTLAYAILALGLVGVMRPVAFVVLLAVSAAVGGRDTLRLLVSARQLWVRPTLTGWLVGIGFVLTLGVALIGMFTPPVLIEWDSLSYHLAVPKLYLKAARIFFIPYDHHSDFPFTMEMLYTLGLGLSSDYLAKGFHLLAGAACVLGIVGFARRFVPGIPAAGPVAGLIFATPPLVTWEAQTAYLDLGLTMFTLLAIYAFAVWWYERNARWLLLSGIMAGLTAGVKMTGLGTVLILGAMLIYVAVRERRALPGLRELAIFALPAVIIAAPWYIKTFIWTGNPVYPFFYSLFGGINWSQKLADDYSAAQAKFGCGHGLLYFLSLPYNLTFHPDVFFDTDVLRAHIGPAFLAFVPIVALKRPLEKGLGLLLVFAGASALIWFILTQQSRYFIPILAPLAICGAVGVLQLGIRSELAGRIVGKLLAVIIGLQVMTSIVVNHFGIPVALGIESRDHYLTWAFTGHSTYEYANTMLPENAKIALYAYPLGYYLDRDYFWADESHSTLIPYQSYTSPDQLVARWKELGITHVIMNRMFGSDIYAGQGDMGRLIKPLLDAPPGKPRLELLFEYETVALYRIDAP